MATSTQSAWLEVGQIFEHFFPEISAMFVTDPAVPTSINVATMLAAVRSGLVATPATAAQYNLPKRGALPDSQKVGDCVPRVGSPQQPDRCSRRG